ncbi:type II secretion system protein [Candidatus Woesebacteria bacterium]|nr:type II secretion system protein [Candidatus Woesebacteria bacterium]
MPAKIKSGFTLIELLIVIAILGLLAVVVIVALNPVENLAKTRDSGRLSTVAQMGHALEAYAANHNGAYVQANGQVGTTACVSAATWVGCLVDAGEVNNTPAVITPAISNINVCTAAPTGATSGVTNGWCYKTTGTGVGPVIVYARLEAKANDSKCANPATESAWALYSSSDGRGGVVCTTDSGGSAVEPTGPAVAGTFVFR